MEGVLRKSDKGILLFLQVQPKSSKTSFGDIVEHEDRQWLQLKVSAPPVDGAANKAVLKFLSKELKVAKSNLEVFKGEKSRYKTVLIRGEVSGKLQIFLSKYDLQL